MSSNNRIAYFVYAAGIAAQGNTSFTRIKGLQSIGVTTRFNLDHIFEIGQIDEYQAVENVPDVEVTAEKCLDGAPLLWHLATQGATGTSLANRANQKCQLAVSYFTDTQNSASGTPLAQATMSGLFGSSLTYSFPVGAPFTESVTFVGNNKTISTSSFSFTGGYLNTDTPPSGVQRRQNMRFGSGAGYSVLPANLPGVTLFGGSGYNLMDSTGAFAMHIQSIRTSVNLGRTPLYELGRKIPYFRTVDFPVEVRTDFEFYCQTGDNLQALETVDNVTTTPIWLRIDDGTVWDLGTKNKLISSTEQGGNAQVGGGNRTVQFSYVNYNNMAISSPSDPSGL